MREGDVNAGSDALDHVVSENILNGYLGELVGDIIGDAVHSLSHFTIGHCQNRLAEGPVALVHIGRVVVTVAVFAYLHPIDGEALRDEWTSFNGDDGASMC